MIKKKKKKGKKIVKAYRKRKVCIFNKHIVPTSLKDIKILLLDTFQSSSTVRNKFKMPFTILSNM